MIKAILPVALLIASISAYAKDRGSEPVLMSVNGKDVPVSEFLYLYGKNTGQQQSNMSVESYLDLFTSYKLKVADAEALGIDTTAAFLNEYNGYRAELAKPYLKNDSLVEKMVAEAYEHKKKEVDVSHIMVAKGNTPEESVRQRALLDSLRSAILSGEDFNEVARKYSIDRAVVRNGGHMGWLLSDRVPYTFEKAAYQTPVGNISDIVETPYGYHIVRVESERPASGNVLVQHILKLTQGHPEEDVPKIKSKIDSIHSLLVLNGDSIDFSEVARRESEDPGSASKGGSLPWFGRGRMVPEFEETAFSLANGEISEPFKTSYGYHIIKRLDFKGLPTLDEARPSIIEAMTKDGRMQEIDVLWNKQLRQNYSANINGENVAYIKDKIHAVGGLDSATISLILASPQALGSVVGVDFYGRDILPAGATAIANEASASSYIDELLEEYVDAKVRNLEIDRMEKENAEFRNLLHEYRDGILLFEVSNMKVWNAASADEPGLKEYFENHREKYEFDAPKYKGYIIYVTNDSSFNDLGSYIHAENPDIQRLKDYVSDKYEHREVRIEKVIAAEGENKFVDAAVFNGNTQELKGRFKHYMVYGGSIIDHPEELADVRANVTADYQQELELKWVETLKSKYPVKINKNQLKKLR